MRSQTSLLSSRSAIKAKLVFVIQFNNHNHVAVPMSTCVAQKKPLGVCDFEWVCFLHPNGLFSVYYLGVYMIFGVYCVLLFSVSTTLKVCIYIIAHKKIKSRRCFTCFL